MLLDRPNGLQAVAGGGDDVNLRELAEQKNQLVEGRRFVVCYHSRNSGGRTYLHPIDRIPVGVTCSRPT